MQLLANLTRSKNKKTSCRKGRGTGSGCGDLSTRGSKGQKQKGSVRPGFEGGQTPFYRTLPIRGFTNSNRLKHKILSIDINRIIRLARKDKIITTSKILNLKMIKKPFAFNKVKIIGNIKEKITNSFTIICEYISKNLKIALEKENCNLIISNKKNPKKVK
ncbi:50S ribosomal protein L15 [Rickettsiales bacterium (ex Bugula neritina AB1)]|nr:50S ribosomal protein L15 [Rickettsiales bacterium (ex Bugula neritina AB1)]